MVRYHAEGLSGYLVALAQPALAEIDFDDLADLAEDPANGWSIGSFGALGEFVRDADEPAQLVRTSDRLTIVTARGAMRLERRPLAGLAWESLSSDGRGWGHNLALCVPRGDADLCGIVPLGPDDGAARPEDREGWLFDLGVARGCVSMCVRTRDAVLKTMLDDAAGQSLLGLPDLGAAILRAQPHRVMLSPAGRIEVFQPIPAPHDVSPEGPHTHLLPGLIASGRLHGANDPIPAGWQAALSMHPPPPWPGPRGQRRLVEARVAAFAPLLARYGSRDDAATARRLIGALVEGRSPEGFAWFEDRRSRAKARIVLRQLAARDRSGVVARWRRVHDRGASSCREVVVWQPRLSRAVPPPAPSGDYLRSLDVAAGIFRIIDREAGEGLRPLVRIGLAALFQASRHVAGDRHVR
ncbi:DUF6925 family protein [Glacieibacterium frigidum]|uniref:Uncharacterized protein n=1 Tax=Glacieibacterium frigidum TaxID=2593303 RepID=A0A552UGA9_9SPHN|nr:hypothetical protein [Glacieibacterium frigidum]TRW17219.1 hypothetical protein FMM06_03220 [Glacieibacterium frigidum]